MDSQNVTLEKQYRKPVVSIRESEKDILLDAEMPGLTKDNIGLEVIGDELTITGKRTDCAVPEGYTVSYRDRDCADYYRKFMLNVTVDREKIDAQYKDGVLTIAIPKSEEAKPKKITVK
ncbi:MAG: Hsp20/alpha crystallin family protein [Endomicrobiales bacterium]